MGDSRNLSGLSFYFSIVITSDAKLLLPKGPGSLTVFRQEAAYNLVRIPHHICMANHSLTDVLLCSLTFLFL